MTINYKKLTIHNKINVRAAFIAEPFSLSYFSDTEWEYLKYTRLIAPECIDPIIEWSMFLARRTNDYWEVREYYGL